MKVTKVLVWMFLLVFVLSACGDNGDDDKDQTPTNGNDETTDNGDDNGYVGDPYEQFEETNVLYERDAWIVMIERIGPFDVSDAQDIFTDRAIEHDDMQKADAAFDFTEFGYPPETFSNVLSFEGEHYVTNYGFEAVGDQVEVTIVSVWRALYYLPNTKQEYLDKVDHPNQIEVISEEIEWDQDIVITARSDMDLEDIMNHYGSHFSTDGWELGTNSMTDEDNHFYGRDDRAQLWVIYDEHDIKFDIWINISTLYSYEEHYKEGYYFITIDIENVVRYLND